MAIAHKILVAAYHILARGVPYPDLGDAYLDNMDKNRTASTLVRRLERLGGGGASARPRSRPLAVMDLSRWWRRSR